LPEARAYCAYVAKSHYENFTVASLLLPRRLVPHFHAVYAYCRWSDDLADETAGGQEALDLIAWWRSELLACYDGMPTHPVMVALRETIRRFDIPPRPLLALLLAFEQDQRVKRYDTFDQLTSYCDCSANPVGHLVLMLFECFDAERARLSDEVCTGLQLANFWQDVARDFAIGRVYLPAEDLRHFGVTEADIASRRVSHAVGNLVRYEVARTRALFERARPIVDVVGSDLAVELALTWHGGMRILEKIEGTGKRLFAERPQLGNADKAIVLARALAWRGETLPPRTVHLMQRVWKRGN
jgi:squalene synthase HpnC